MLKLGCTLPNLAKICSHKSNGYKFYPFSSETELLEKVLEYMTSGPAIVLMKTAANETFIRKPDHLCKSRIELLPVNSILNRCVKMYTRWDYLEEILNFKASLYHFRTFQNSVMSIFQASGPECKTESYCTTRK